MLNLTDHPAVHICDPGDPTRTPAATQHWCRCGLDWLLRDDDQGRYWVLVPTAATSVAGGATEDEGRR